MTRFIYNGFYYPVIGDNNGWENGRTKQVSETRIGGWANADRWWSFSIGIKCRLFNPDKPYRQKVLQTIRKHPEMIIKREFFDDGGKLIVSPTEDQKKVLTSLVSVTNKNGLYIGNIGSAYFLTEMEQFQGSNPGSKTVSVAFNFPLQKWCGWSHRAMCCFSLGDKLFEADYGTDTTPYIEHGSIEISDISMAKTSAQNFAQYVS